MFIFALVTWLINRVDSGVIFTELNRRKEGNVLFNHALNTFDLRLYGVRQMVKDHSDSEMRKPAAAT